MTWVAVVAGLVAAGVLILIVAAVVMGGQADDALGRDPELSDVLVGSDDLGNEFVVPLKSVSHPVGYPAETGSAHHRQNCPSEEPDVSTCDSGAGSVPVPGGRRTTNKIVP